MSIKLRALLPFLAMAAVLGGCGRAIDPANSAQLQQWRSEGRLAAGPWQEPVLYGAHASTVDLLWVRHEARGGLVSLVPVDDAASSSLGTKAATDLGFARWATRPWTQVSEASLKHLPGGCFVLSKPEWGLTVTTPAGTHTWNASHYRSLAGGRTLFFGAARGHRGMHERSEAVLLDERGATAASWSIPPGSHGRMDFVGPWLLSVHTLDRTTTVAVLDPSTLTPVLTDQPFAVSLDHSFGAERDFTHLILRDPSAPDQVAKLVFTHDGPIELPFAYDRLRPYQVQGTQLAPSGGAGSWQVDAWLAEQEGRAIAVLNRNGDLLAGGLTAAEAVSVTGFVHAVGSPGSIPGFVVCDTQGQWRVVWLDGVEPSPPMAQRDWAVGGASSQRGSLNVQSINESNRRAVAATQAALARQAAMQAEAARLKAIAESQAREFTRILDAFEGHLTEKHTAQALAVVERINHRAMHVAHPERWERTCMTCAKLAIEADDMWSVLVISGILRSIPMQPKSELSKVLADVDAKIAKTTLSRITPDAASTVVAPAHYVRELPGERARAFEGRMKMEMQAYGATYYGR